jgi:hypothetical protein
LPAVRLTAHTSAKLSEGGIFVSYMTTGRIGYRRFRQCRPADRQGTKLRIAVYGRRKSHSFDAVRRAIETSPSMRRKGAKVGAEEGH